MIYYDIINAEYLTALKDKATVYRTILQPLDEYENVIGEIYADLLMSESPKLEVGSNNGIRRTLTFALYNADKQYSPNKNSLIWYKRKMKVLESVTVGSNEYRITMGVLICREATEREDGIIAVTAIDKYGMLNGELNYGRSTQALATDLSAGDIYVGELIRETLTLGRGTGMLDPVKPMIENIFNGTKLYADISLGAGQPYGAVLTSLGQMYGADCCYDRTGRFRFVRRPDYNDPTAYKHRGYAWEFDEGDVNIFEGAQRQTTFKAVNTVTVSTDNTEGAICSVTVRNTNPLSPVSTRNIGEQLADESTVYISVGDTTRGSAEDKCREYGTYLLLQNTKQACSISFSTALIPHLDVDDLIRYKGEDMLITQISADLDTKIMTIAAVNVAELPEIEVSTWT